MAKTPKAKPAATASNMLATNAATLSPQHANTVWQLLHTGGYLPKPPANGATGSALATLLKAMPPASVRGATRVLSANHNPAAVAMLHGAATGKGSAPATLPPGALVITAAMCNGPYYRGPRNNSWLVTRLVQGNPLTPGKQTFDRYNNIMWGQSLDQHYAARKAGKNVPNKNDFDWYMAHHYLTLVPPNTAKPAKAPSKPKGGQKAQPATPVAAAPANPPAAPANGQQTGNGNAT